MTFEYLTFSNHFGTESKIPDSKIRLLITFEQILNQMVPDLVGSYFYEFDILFHVLMRL